ncbi:MAG: accessory gene regulator B family protein [Peptococcaceae bacterium]|jgi:accessory gene regulator B|nr:accessory gene regulator B family protein [Peptococcaceae bacterium]MDH7525827.1 accessory gene regulator B family protein [Peptococcaceae bacterium]
MRFVNKWAYGCAVQLAGIMNESHQQRAVYYYGFQIIIGALVKGAVLAAVSLLLGILLPSVLIAFTFGTLRLLAGGYHMDTYGKCLLVSLALFTAAGLTAQHTGYYWSAAQLGVLAAVTFAFGLYAVLRYAPSDTPNKRITEEAKRKKLKMLSAAWLGIWLLTVTLLVFLGAGMAVLALCFAVLLETFTVTPAGHVFFESIKNGLGKRKAAYEKKTET